MMGLRVSLLGLVFLLQVPLTQARAEQPKGKIDYNRQVRPILSNNCLSCHGPDEDAREAGLRLDIRAQALGPTEYGEPAIIPGDPKASELIKRVNSRRAGVVMPPPETNKTLTAEEKQILEDWVAQGAGYETHWAFTPPTRPAPPRVSDPGWERNPIDAFARARLDKEGLQPSPEADRTTLIRRLSLDLTGLPPTPQEVDQFLEDGAPGAYDRLVDRLLASPRFGERMALDWLDAARFADTHGYHIDSGRDMTRWREWVISAFNANMPFDQFTVEQIAGDLLPNPTLSQQVASGFNRNHMITFEGGAIPEEYHTAYIIDRVNTTGTVWLGLSVGCAQCHDHKYDPLTQREYYQLYAFFNNVPEKGLDGNKGNAAPFLKAPSVSQSQAMDRMRAEIEALRIAATAEGPPAPADVERLQERAAELAAYEAAVPSAMVMKEMDQPRETSILIRGEYNKKGEKVTPGVPGFLPSLPGDGRPDRLALARWLVDPGHPLVARVTVNRIWQAFFGTGLVKTAEDFGTQGELPSHPELLDWLATEFVAPSSPADRPWDVKGLVRKIVTSATYRQSSAADPASFERDPENRLLSRGPRFRLQAEFIRDQALAVSGLLNGEIGGKSVSPYQPPGLWEELMSRADSKNWTAQTYVQSQGKDLYRRTMYTFWKRTSPPPSLSTFDAPDRETCAVRRARTNTPLQALVLMNDPTYVEASRHLARRALHEAGPAEDDRLRWLFRLAAARRPSADELAVLRDLLRSERERFLEDRAAAEAFLAAGDSPRDTRLDPAEHAAWASIASAILNLDEVLNKN